MCVLFCIHQLLDDSWQQVFVECTILLVHSRAYYFLKLWCEVEGDKIERRGEFVEVQQLHNSYHPAENNERQTVRTLLKAKPTRA